jgi:uncharacterized protein
MDYIKIGEHIFPTLLAITYAEQEQGLMGRQWPPPVMTFVYGRPCQNKFWMKDTISPLEILFCLNGKITYIYNGIPHSLSVMGSDDPSDLVIELPAGTCSAYNIGVGDSIYPQFSDENKMKILMLKSGIHI